MTNLMGRPSMLGPPTRNKPADGGAELKPVPKPSLNGSILGRPRPSLIPRASIQNPRASLIPSLNQSSRRSTAFNTSATVSGQRKDPRDWRDKGFLVSCQKRLMKFLSESGYPYGLSGKSLSSPSNKEFFQMFQFLYLKFDPSYKFGPKPEDEVIPLLASLQYPFKIAKSSLITPGTPHVWPSLIGAMLWMSDLLEYIESVARHQEEDLETEDEEDKEKWIRNFITQAYGAWLHGKDEEHERLYGDLIAFYESRREMALSNVDNLTNSIHTLSKEIEQIQRAPSRVEALAVKKNHFIEDINKIKNFIATMQDQKEALTAAIAEMNTTIEVEQREIDQRVKENEELQEIIDCQEITPADVERMVSARQSLEQTLQMFGEQRESIQKEVWMREVEVQKASDSLDRAISLFNSTATNLRLVGPSAKYSHDIISENFRCITFSPHAPTADKMLNCSTKQDIKPCLTRLKDHLLEKAKSLHDKFMNLHMELETICESVDEQRENVNDLDLRLHQSVQSYRSMKHAVAEASKRYESETESIRQEAKKLRADIAVGWAQSEKAVAGANEQLEENERTYTREREVMVQFIAETLGALMEHKSNITDALAALNQRLDAELEATTNL